MKVKFVVEAIDDNGYIVATDDATDFNINVGSPCGADQLGFADEIQDFTYSIFGTPVSAESDPDLRQLYP